MYFVMSTFLCPQITYVFCNSVANLAVMWGFYIYVQVVIKEKVLELLLYFTKHEDEEVKTKAIIGLGKKKKKI